MTTFEENKLLQLIQSYNCSSLITLPYQSPINKRIYTSIWFLHINWINQIDPSQNAAAEPVWFKSSTQEVFFCK